MTQKLPDGPFFRGGFSQPALVSGKGDGTEPATASRIAGQARWWKWRHAQSR